LSLFSTPGQPLAVAHLALVLPSVVLEVLRSLSEQTVQQRV
jgi:hypothetical protein